MRYLKKRSYNSRELDEESIKTKFENSSRILDDILNSQRASSDRSGLGFNKEKKP